jgi:hypothetical protein
MDRRSETVQDGAKRPDIGCRAISELEYRLGSKIWRRDMGDRTGRMVGQESLVEVEYAKPCRQVL